MKRLKYELPKEVMKRAKEQLVTLNVARTELIARLDILIKNGNLLADTKKVLGSAKNSLDHNLKQDDLVGALRDKLNQPVRDVGARITMAQMTSYHAEAEHFLKLCATAKTDGDLEKAAEQFASVVKQGGIDITLTLATARK